MDITQIGAAALVAAGRQVDADANKLANIDDEPPLFQPPDHTYSPIVSGGSAAIHTQDVQQPNNMIVDALGLLNASVQYDVAASLVKTGEDISATTLQTIA